MDSFIYSNGGSVLNDDGTCALDKPEAIGGLQYLVDLLPYAPEGMANAATGDMRELFLNGSLAIEWWPALEQPTLQGQQAELGLCQRHRAEGQDAGRHLRRLEPGGLRAAPSTRTRPGSSSNS